MLVNGVISAAIPASVMLAGGTPLAFSWYSVLMALTIVSISAINVITTFQCYAHGQIATVGILSTLGNIILPCLWGVFVLNEALTVQSILAIAVMLSAVVLLGNGGGEKLNKKLLWLYIVVVLTGAGVTILSKQHQVETVFETVDTLSFSVWIALIRIVLFGFLTPFVAKKQGKAAFRFPKAAVWFAVFSSVVAGSSYVMTLFSNTALPIVITAPLNTGLSIIMSALLPWLIYREQLSKKQLLGVGLSLVGALLFLIA